MDTYKLTLIWLAQVLVTVTLTVGLFAAPPGTSGPLFADDQNPVPPEQEGRITRGARSPSLGTEGSFVNAQNIPPALDSRSVVAAPITPSQGSAPAPTGGNSSETDFDTRINVTEEIARSSWFALVSGLASILGLLLAQYGTQVRPLPYSLYRSLVWRKALLLASGVGIYVACCVGFYFQPRPRLELLGLLHAFLHGELFPIERGQGGPLWAIGIVVGTLVALYAALDTPLPRVRDMIITEGQALRIAEELELARARERHVDKGSREEHRQEDTLDDITRFYQELRFRLIDLGMGAPSGRPFFERWAGSHQVRTSDRERT